jgi:predicted TIM-barrel fold metal-dependent hydrolase
MEFEPALFDIMRELAGNDLAERFRSASWENVNYASYPRNYVGQFLTLEEALDDRAPRSPWWGLPTKNTVDRAATVLPGLLEDYMHLVGIDYTVLYPTLGLYPPTVDDEEMRLAGCRAVNTYLQEIVKGHEAYMTAVAVIPMHTPQEAIAELDFVVNTLGAKAIVVASHVARPVPKALRLYPEAAVFSQWMDFFAIDSAYDYDPFWAKCVELGVSPTFHTPIYGNGVRGSVTNWMFNHVGAFAAGAEAICRALTFGGVPNRFPNLNFGFLEGGVGYAVSLYADLIGHWKKRNKNAIRDYDPARIDMDLLRHLFKTYGGPLVQARLERVGQQEMKFKAFTAEAGVVDAAALDEFAAMQVEKPEDFKRIFSHYYFGCEADDPVNAAAYNTKLNPYGQRFNVVLSSDIGHFDVPDISEVLEEAHELVDDGLFSADDFRDFTFATPARLWTGSNPDFFKGTSVEAAVAKELGG